MMDNDLMSGACLLIMRYINLITKPTYGMDNEVEIEETDKKSLKSLDKILDMNLL